MRYMHFTLCQTLYQRRICVPLVILRKAGLIEDECLNKYRLIGEATEDDHIDRDVGSRLKIATDFRERTRILSPKSLKTMILMKESLNCSR